MSYWLFVYPIFGIIIRWIISVYEYLIYHNFEYLKAYWLKVAHLWYFTKFLIFLCDIKNLIFGWLTIKMVGCILLNIKEHFNSLLK